MLYPCCWERRRALPSVNSHAFSLLFPSNYEHKGELLREKVLLLKQLLCSARELQPLRLFSSRLLILSEFGSRAIWSPKRGGAPVWQGVLPVPLHVCVQELGICGDRNEVQQKAKQLLQQL